MSRHTTGSLTVAALAASWGIIGIIVREVDAPPMAIVFFRVALAGLVVAAVLLLRRRRDLFRLRNRSQLALGVLLALHWSVYFAAIKETSVASAVLITYAAPIFMAILAAALLREHVPPVSLASLGISIGGIALITLSGGGGEEAVRPLGVALAVVAAVTYALLIVLTKKYLAEIDPITVVFWESVVATLVLLPGALIPDYSLDGTDVAYLVVLGVVLTGVSGILYLGALRFIPATTAGILAYVEPVSAALLAALLLGEELTTGIVIGGALIVAAGIAVVLRAPDPLAGAVEQPVPAGPRPT